MPATEHGVARQCLLKADRPERHPSGNGFKRSPDPGCGICIRRGCHRSCRDGARVVRCHKVAEVFRHLAKRHDHQDQAGKGKTKNGFEHQA